MKNQHEPGANREVADKAIRHIDHYGGGYESWYVGVEEVGSDRDHSDDRRLARYELKSEQEAKLTMSRLLDLGLQADDEYGAEPTILFVFTRKRSAVQG